MQEIPRLRSINGCVKVRENYRDIRGVTYHCFFDPNKSENIFIARNELKKNHACYGMKIKSRLYYDVNDNVIFSEMF